LPDSGPAPAPPRKRAQTSRARITKVIDGDTIRIRPLEPTRRSRYTVRLIGIDTPETKKRGTPIECGGKEATSSMLDISFRDPRDTDGDGLLDTKGGRGARVKLITDPTQRLFATDAAYGHASRAVGRGKRSDSCRGESSSTRVPMR